MERSSSLRARGGLRRPGRMRFRLSRKAQHPTNRFNPFAIKRAVPIEKPLRRQVHRANRGIVRTAEGRKLIRKQRALLQEREAASSVRLQVQMALSTKFRSRLPPVPIAAGPKMPSARRRTSMRKSLRRKARKIVAMRGAMSLSCLRCSAWFSVWEDKGC